MNEEQQADADMLWWRQVGELIGATLCGWSYRHAASFVNPQIEVDGKVAKVLMEQANRIEQLQKRLPATSQRGVRSAGSDSYDASGRKKID